MPHTNSSSLTSLPPASPGSWRCCSRPHHAARHLPCGLTSTYVSTRCKTLPSQEQGRPPGPPSLARRTAHLGYICSLLARNQTSAGLPAVRSQKQQPKSPPRATKAALFLIQARLNERCRPRSSLSSVHRQPVCLARGCSRARAGVGRRGLIQGGGRTSVDT